MASWHRRVVLGPPLPPRGTVPGYESGPLGWIMRSWLKWMQTAGELGVRSRDYIHRVSSFIRGPESTRFTQVQQPRAATRHFAHGQLCALSYLQGSPTPSDGEFDRQTPRHSTKPSMF